MPILRFRRMLDQILNPVLSFREIRHSLFMMIFALIPTLSVFVVFEACLPKNVVVQMTLSTRKALTGNDLAPLFNYYIVWVAHMLVSVGVGVGAARGAFRNTSAVKKTVLKRFRLVVFLFLMLIVVASDAMHSNLALLSHQRIFNILSAEPSLSRMFRHELIFAHYTIFVPTIFSFFPVAGVGAALWAMSTIILCASKFLVESQRSDDDGDPNDRIMAFSDAIEALRSHLLALSLVLVTSTLATIAFFRIPLGFFGPGTRESFRAITDATGLVWGITFSLTLAALCVYPFSVLRKQFETLQNDARRTNNEILARWLRKNRAMLQVPTNLQLVLSMLSPATIAVLSHLVSS
jgi:hypothetical protein